MRIITSLVFVLTLLVLPNAHAALIPFDDAISGATSYGFDGDGDSIDDVIFSTTDPLGFNTVGPGPNMSYIDEPGLEGTTSLAPDLRVDFLNGAVGALSFGFAVDTSGFVADALSFSIYDAADNLLASILSDADHTATGSGSSDFPEAQVSLGFTGLAAYALFDFDDSSAPRYIIDNFAGTFGSSENVVPEPGMLVLIGSGLIGLGFIRRKRNC